MNISYFVVYNFFIFQKKSILHMYLYNIMIIERINMEIA